jgi:hypothetical protein
MTIGQLELPLFEIRSSADNPVPEQDRTHPAQMIIRHCGSAKVHGCHPYETGDGPWGCPGVPDLRDRRTPETVQNWLDANNTVAMPLYYRPMPLSNGVIDRCEATRDGVRCAWKGHFGTRHSWGEGRDKPAMRDRSRRLRPVEDVELP